MSSLRKLLLSLAAVLMLAGLSNVPLSAAKPGSTTPKLSLTVSPSTITEGDIATGTVTHNSSSTSSAVTVTLGSSDTSEATVPASVTIPAGTNSVTFTVTAVNDGTSDGDQTATLSASAGGYTSASAAVTISDKPTFQYRIEAIPTGTNNSIWINGITNNSRVYGWLAQTISTYKSGFVYDQVSQTMYDLNQIPVLTAQVHMLAGSDFSFSSITGMNETGLMTGSLKDSSGTYLGFAIDTTVDGQFSPDPADWDVELLPDFGSTYTFGWRINESGDILGRFTRADGTIGAYLHNPWLGGTPVQLPANLRFSSDVALNDLAQVGGIDDLGRAILYGASTDTMDDFADANYQSVSGLNNSGVFAGTALVTVPATKGNRNTTTRTAHRHDGTFRPIAGSWSIAAATCLNEAGDVAYFDSAYNSMLSHTGFAPDYTEQQFRLTRVIANDDPLKATFVDHQPDVFAINDRNATGYPQLVVRLYFPNSSGGNDNVAVILTPYLVP